jgi:hypothetical protein
MGAATWWDPIIAVVLTLAAIGGLVVFGGRVYAGAILHTGGTLKVRDAWHGTPVPGPSGGGRASHPSAWGIGTRSLRTDSGR